MKNIFQKNKIMEKKNKLWIYFVSRRFAKVDNTGRYAINSFFAAAGIALGVAALIVIISVMNGFQMGYIDSIMEISSFHVRIENPSKDFDFANMKISESEDIRSFVEIYEAQTLMVGRGSRQYPALVRGVPENILETDSGFRDELIMVSGEFDLSSPNTCVIGSTLARRLGVSVGDTVNLLAMSGSSDTDLFSSNRNLTIVGTFTCGYSDIVQTFAFVSLETGSILLGEDVLPLTCLKLKNQNQDGRIISKIQSEIQESNLPDLNCESWRSYNRSFFGALKIEKNVLMFLSFLIFVVVAINIYNSMRRLVYERREEIAVLQALGSSQKDTKLIFTMQGLITGIKGSIPGLIIGLLICFNMEKVFMGFSWLMGKLSYLFNLIFNPTNASAMASNSIFMYYSKIPARVVVSEVVLITLFGILSSYFAAYLASKNIMKSSVSEVLRDE